MQKWVASQYIPSPDTAVVTSHWCAVEIWSTWFVSYFLSKKNWKDKNSATPHDQYPNWNLFQQMEQWFGIPKLHLKNKFRCEFHLISTPMLCFLFVLRVQSSNMKIYALETFAFVFQRPLSYFHDFHRKRLHWLSVPATFISVSLTTR